MLRQIHFSIYVLCLGFLLNTIPNPHAHSLCQQLTSIDNALQWCEWQLLSDHYLSTMTGFENIKTLPIALDWRNYREEAMVPMQVDIWQKLIWSDNLWLVMACSPVLTIKLMNNSELTVDLKQSTGGQSVLCFSLNPIQVMSHSVSDFNGTLLIHSFEVFVR